MGMHRTRVYPVRVTRHTRYMYVADLDAYTAHLRAAGMSTGTIRLRRAHIERCLSWLRMSPAQVTPDDLIGYMAAHEWAPETRKSMRSSLRGFFAWLEDEERIPDDPARKLPSVKIPPPDPHPTPDHVVHQTTAAVADSRVALMIDLGRLAGLRRAEIASLHTDCLVGDDLIVTGKGGRTRTIPAHPILIEALQSLPRGYVFPGKVDGHLSPDWVGRLMTEALGGPHTWSAHSLRHRFATRAYATERDILAVSSMLGHSSVATTQRYTKMPDDAKRRAIADVA